MDYGPHDVSYEEHYSEMKMLKTQCDDQIARMTAVSEKLADAFCAVMEELERREISVDVINAAQETSGMQLNLLYRLSKRV